jgi:hypothetical protein
MALASNRICSSLSSIIFVCIGEHVTVNPLACLEVLYLVIGANDQWTQFSKALNALNLIIEKRWSLTLLSCPFLY